MKTIKKCLGTLIAADMYNCDEAVLKDIEKTEKALADACREYCMDHRQIIHFQEEGQSEYSITVICNQGHITLHVYPDMGFMTADVFSCYKNANPADMARHLRRYFDADKSKITLLDRGDFGTENDMKPHRRSQIKFIRRTRDLSGKLKQMILKPRSI